MKSSHLKIVAFFLSALVVIAIAASLFKGGFVTSKKTLLHDSKNVIKETPELPFEGKAPGLVGIEDWINTAPLSEKDLQGKVVLVDFWTYSCINCIRTLPHLDKWYKTYKDNGFILLGVHSPEFDFEKKKENVREAVAKYHIEYPVLLDNNHETWNAFANQYWPAHYLIDTKGNIRYHRFGEGHYEETEGAIQKLLREAGLLTLDKVTAIKEALIGVDFAHIGTPEIYLGYLRLNNVGSDVGEVRPDEPYTFSEPELIEDNRFYFVGKWNIARESANFLGKEGKLIVRYKANKANMVLGLKGNAPLTLEVKLDGASMTDGNKGVDVYLKNGKSLIDVSSSRLYNFSDTSDDYGWHTLEILIPSQGLEAFTFTFG